ncbi:MAG: ribosome-binding ATPase YchF [Patescibacteria group bacterium]|nr:MAG: ribosome-binding ATPase YchF [Patescibacteria group bacterium]
MKLSVGIVGFPNVGKSTLFNAVLKKQQALTANYPFATIEPNTGIVDVPDPWLKPLSDIVKNEEQLKEPPPIIPATVTFIDIAGLVKGAHKGEGLGNQFLSHIREVTAICHILRDFDDENIIREGASDPKTDLEVIRIELALKDLETLNKQKEPKGKLNLLEKERWTAVQLFKQGLERGVWIKNIIEQEENPNKKQILQSTAKQLNLLTAKEEIFVVNIDEEKLQKNDLDQLTAYYQKLLNEPKEKIIVMNNKLEMDLAGFTPEEQQILLKEYGLEKPALERLIKTAYNTLGLMSFYTAGKKEVRAWTIIKGSSAQQAAGVIHSDFEKLMISAKVVKVEDFIQYQGWNNCKTKGKIRIEGREYIMQENEVVEFNIGK